MKTEGNDLDDYEVPNVFFYKRFGKVEVKTQSCFRENSVIMEARDGRIKNIPLLDFSEIICDMDRETYFHWKILRLCHKANDYQFDKEIKDHIDAIELKYLEVLEDYNGD